MKEAHAVSEQLIKSVLEKFENGINPSVDDVIDSWCNDENSNLVSFDKTIYESELNEIKSLLEVDFLDEDKFIEFDFIIGDCYLCNEKVEDNLIIHLNDRHNISIKDTIEDNCCLICGEKLVNKKSFTKHQFNLHNVVSFLSLNKLFKVKSDDYDNKTNKNMLKMSIFNNLNISNKMRERVNLIRNQNKRKKKQVKY